MQSIFNRLGFNMYNLLSDVFAVVRASIGAHNALYHMNYSQPQDMEALKATFLANVTTQIDATYAKSEAPADITLVGA